MTDKPKAHDHLGTDLGEDGVEFGEEILDSPGGLAASEAVIRLLGARKAKPSEIVHVVSTLSSLLYCYTDYTYGEILDLSLVASSDPARTAALEELMKKAGFEVRDLCPGCGETHHSPRNIPSA